MADDTETEQTTGAVSPLRKKISTAVLVGLIVVLGIELRAGIGHMQTGKALQARAPEGAFEDTGIDDLDKMLVLSPSRTIVRETPDETEYRYAWLSLLRPLFSRPEAAYYIVVMKTTEPFVARYSPEAPSEQEVTNSRLTMERFLAVQNGEFDSSANDESGSGGHDAHGEESGSMPPPGPDPTAIVLDADGDGEISESELSGAPEALFAADKNADGVLTRDELPQESTTPPAAQRRPPVEDEDQPTPAEPADDAADTDAAGETTATPAATDADQKDTTSEEAAK